MVVIVLDKLCFIFGRHPITCPFSPVKIEHCSQQQDEVNPNPDAIGDIGTDAAVLARAIRSLPSNSDVLVAYIRNLVRFSGANQTIWIVHSVPIYLGNQWTFGPSYGYVSFGTYGSRSYGYLQRHINVSRTPYFLPGALQMSHSRLLPRYIVCFANVRIPCGFQVAILMDVIPRTRR